MKEFFIKIKEFFKSKLGKAVILTVPSALNLILTIACYSTNLSEAWSFSYENGVVNLWTCTELQLIDSTVYGLNTYLIIAFLVGILLTAISIAIALWKDKRSVFYVSFAYNAVLSLAVLVLNLVFRQLLQSGAIICAVLSAGVSVAALIFMILRRNKQVAAKQTEEVDVEPKKAKIYKTGMFVCEIVAMLVSFSLFFVPLYSLTIQDQTTTYNLIYALAPNDGSYPVLVSVCFVITFFACLASLFSFVSSASFFGRSNSLFAKKAQEYMYFATVLAVLFFIMGFGITFFTNAIESVEFSVIYYATTVSFIPSLIVFAALVVHSVFQGRLTLATEIVEKHKAPKKQLKFEPLVYVFILTAITFASLALVLIDAQVSYSGVPAYEIKKTGYELVLNYQELDAELQVLAFAFVAMLLVSGIQLMLSLVSYFTRSKDYFTIVKTSAFTNFVFMLMVGLFGIYYGIAQKINSEHIISLLQQQSVSIAPDQYVDSVTSQSYIALIASFAVLVIMFLRKQFNLSAEPVAEKDEQAEERKEPAPTPLQEEAVDTTAKESVPEKIEKPDFDACPAFTELDGKISIFENELEIKRQSLFTNLTLPNLVRFIVDYARESRLHLSYSLEDIATFVAGLGASRLTILQGMSGTGKTSLPKIFTEAIMGNCEIVEVESSWRDKNELLGYYNEFSKCFTPKKFTQCLYKARLNSSVPTFIVLDEMNLSRIEYYFSDFLSLMENEEHKREIKLLNIKLFRQENGQRVPYRGLTDGHTIKIPTNVWFIGTANRDESTFEISDKVYDRAQTINFNRRAPKVHSFSEPLPQRFASYDMLNALFEEAKREYEFEAEDNAIIQKVEKILMPYNISFGNRILKQMEDFVKIYCTCFGDKQAAENDAVEKILLSKVVSKLETKIVENKDALAVEFSKLGLSRCSAFIQKLNED